MAKTPSADKKPVQEPRRLNTGEYRSFRLQKKIKTGDPKIAGSFTLLKGAMSVVRKNWKQFLGIIALYGLLNMILVQSFSGDNLDQAKTLLEEGNESAFSSLAASLSLFVYMAATSGNLNSEVAGAYQLMLTITTSLALIWAYRQAYAEKRFRIRDAFYRGMHPLVPFALVLLTATLQLAPIVLGGFLYNLVSTTGIAASGIEIILWGVVFFLLALMSLYMLSATLFALYIVCLPDMTPMVALRSARDLVEFRRWVIMRRIIFLPIFLMILSMVIIVPIIFVSAALAGFLFFITSMLGLLIIHGYMYRLYRELL